MVHDSYTQFLLLYKSQESTGLLIATERVTEAVTCSSTGSSHIHLKRAARCPSRMVALAAGRRTTALSPLLPAERFQRKLLLQKQAFSGYALIKCKQTNKSQKQEKTRNLQT